MTNEYFRMNEERLSLPDFLSNPSREGKVPAPFGDALDMFLEKTGLCKTDVARMMHYSDEQTVIRMVGRKGAKTNGRHQYEDLTYPPITLERLAHLASPPNYKISQKYPNTKFNGRIALAFFDEEGDLFLSQSRGAEQAIYFLSPIFNITDIMAYVNATLVDRATQKGVDSKSLTKGKNHLLEKSKLSKRLPEYLDALSLQAGYILRPPTIGDHQPKEREDIINTHIEKIYSK